MYSYFRGGRRIRFVIWTFVILLVIEGSLRLAGAFILYRYYSNQDRAYFPDGTNILCLGESSTFGLWVKPEESYPGQLQERLRKITGNSKIQSIVPPHIGHNTSQIANRIDDYLERYKPALIILMTGINNIHSFGESHVVNFLPSASFDLLKFKALIYLDQLRLFKVIRYSVDRLSAGFSRSQRSIYEIWGHPKHVPDETPPWITDLTRENLEAFRQSFRYDINLILKAAARTQTPVILMTYHLTQKALLRSIVRLADENNLPLVRNDLTFLPLEEEGRLKDYLLDDNWHPSAKGYSLIANNIIAELTTNTALQRASNVRLSVSNVHSHWRK